MNILLVGSSGFLGQTIYNALRKSHAVKCPTSRAGDIRTAEFVGVDAVINASGIAHSPKTNLEQYRRVNTLFPFELASVASAVGVSKLIHLSSISVFGSNAQYIDESTLESPDCAYGTSKLEGDDLLMSLQSERFDVVVLRLPMVYGPNAPGNPMRLKRLIRLLPVLPLGGISNRRSFISITNVVVFIESALRHHRCNGVLLICDDEPVSTTELVNYIAAAHDLNICLANFPLIRGFIKRAAPSFAEKLFGDLTVSNVIAKEKLSVDISLPFG